MEQLILNFKKLKSTDEYLPNFHCAIRRTIKTHSSKIEFPVLDFGAHFASSQKFYSNGEEIPRDKIISYAVYQPDFTL